MSIFLQERSDLSLALALLSLSAKAFTEISSTLAAEGLSKPSKLLSAITSRSLGDN
jgi:hypothetical protein